MHEVWVNDRKREYQEEISINDLLTELELTTSKGIAIAVNEEVIPRTTWKDCLLKHADKVLIIQATQGG